MSLLSIQNVSLTFPNVEKPILSDINYHIDENDFIIVLGSNGSGKSSLLKLLDRRYQTTKGSIQYQQQMLSTISNKQFTSEIKTLTQNCHESLFTSLTIFENYLLMRNSIRSLTVKEKQERAFLMEYLADYNPNLSKKLDQITMQLSGGEKQALALALTMLQPPKLLLLDEHTSALDPKTAENIMQLTQKVITDHRITCLLTTHDLHIAKSYGNRILSLKNGKIHHTIDSDRKLITQHETLLAACY